ncbi:unnamed protein product, partial [Symbiodinium pilosum]
MPAADLVPNEISFNASISACEKGGEWQLALSLLAQMPAAGVVPSEISSSAGIAACGAARQWRMALSLFSCMLSNGQTPDRESYTQILDAVCTERLSFGLFRQALQEETWPNMLRGRGALLDLHDHSGGSAMLAVLWWLAEIVPWKMARGKHHPSFGIITGGGKSRASWQTTDVRASVLRLLARCGIPCKVHPRNQGLV